MAFCPRKKKKDFVFWDLIIKFSKNYELSLSVWISQAGFYKNTQGFLIGFHLSDSDRRNFYLTFLFHQIDKMHELYVCLLYAALMKLVQIRTSDPSYTG